MKCSIPKKKLSLRNRFESSGRNLPDMAIALTVWAYAAVDGGRRKTNRSEVKRERSKSGRAII